MPERLAGGITLVFNSGVPAERITDVVRAVNSLAATEVGRLVLSFIPKSLKINYFRGDATKRSRAVFDRSESVWDSLRARFLIQNPCW